MRVERTYVTAYETGLVTGPPLHKTGPNGGNRTRLPPVMGRRRSPDLAGLIGGPGVEPGRYRHLLFSRVYKTHPLTRATADTSFTSFHERLSPSRSPRPSLGGARLRTHPAFDTGGQYASAYGGAWQSGQRTSSCSLRKLERPSGIEPAVQPWQGCSLTIANWPQSWWRCWESNPKNLLAKQT